MLDSLKINWQTRSPKLKKPSPPPKYQSFIPNQCKAMAHLLLHLRRNLSHNSLLSDSFGLFRGTWNFPALSDVNCPDFAAKVTAFFCPLIYAR